MADENDPEGNRDPEENVENQLNDEDPNDEDEEIGTLVQTAAQEYVALDSTLDQIDTYLNDLDKKNDDLYSKVAELLESSRQTRLELQQANEDKSGENQGDINQEKQS